jgi:hypothetical protein
MLLENVDITFHYDTSLARIGVNQVAMVATAEANFTADDVEISASVELTDDDIAAVRRIAERAMERVKNNL